MKPMEAWSIISANLANLYRRRKADLGKGWDDADIEAEVMCYRALKQMEARQEMEVGDQNEQT